MYKKIIGDEVDRDLHAARSECDGRSTKFLHCVVFIHGAGHPYTSGRGRLLLPNVFKFTPSAA